MVTRRFLVGILAVFALGGCITTSSPSDWDRNSPAYSQRADATLAMAPASHAHTRIYGDVFQAGFQQIRDIYVRDVDLGMLAVDGLSGLSSLDPRISADRVEGRLRVRLADRVIGDFAVASSDSPYDWARITTGAIDRLRAASPRLQEAPAEDIYSAVFDAITADLDPYSRYIGANQARSERARRDGYGGIGVVLDVDEEDRPYIQDVFSNGPAAHAGMIAGSRFLAVDGRPISSFELDELGDALRGRVNTTVRIRVALPGGGEREYAIQRAQVIPSVVTTEIDQDILVLELSRFNAATAAQIGEAVVNGMRQLGPAARGVVLDLRGNPGGLLDQSIAVADMFLPRGEIIRTRGRHPNSFQQYPAESQDLLNGLPMVVLVDGRSASGAEVVAAALQDSGRAVVVGASSFGKGSVQTVTRLPNEGELFLTWSEIYTPLGYTLNRQGVLPTICTAGTTLPADELLEQLRQGSLPMPTSLATWRLEASTDRQALDRLRNICPWTSQDGAIDMTLAKMLLLDDALYYQALTMAKDLARRTDNRAPSGTLTADVSAP